MHEADLDGLNMIANVLSRLRWPNMIEMYKADLDGLNMIANV